MHYLCDKNKMSITGRIKGILWVFLKWSESRKNKNKNSNLWVREQEGVRAIFWQPRSPSEAESGSLWRGVWGALDWALTARV